MKGWTLRHLILQPGDRASIEVHRGGAEPGSRHPTWYGPIAAGAQKPTHEHRFPVVMVNVQPPPRIREATADRAPSALLGQKAVIVRAGSVEKLCVLLRRPSTTTGHSSKRPSERLLALRPSDEDRPWRRRHKAETLQARSGPGIGSSSPASSSRRIPCPAGHAPRHEPSRGRG